MPSKRGRLAFDFSRTLWSRMNIFNSIRLLFRHLFPHLCSRQILKTDIVKWNDLSLASFSLMDCVSPTTCQSYSAQPSKLVKRCVLQMTKVSLATVLMRWNNTRRSSQVIAILCQTWVQRKFFFAFSSLYFCYYWEINKKERSTFDSLFFSKIKKLKFFMLISVICFLFSDWSILKLFGHALKGTCPLATSSVVYVDVTDNTVSLAERIAIEVFFFFFFFSLTNVFLF